MDSTLTTDHAQAERKAPTLEELATPCLILDADRMERNITRLRARLDRLGVALRPHLKTAKSVEVARRVMSSMKLRRLRQYCAFQAGSALCGCERSVMWVGK